MWNTIRKFIATGADDGIIFVFDVETGQETHKIDGLAPVTALLWSDTAYELYAGFGNGTVLLTDVRMVRLVPIFSLTVFVV